jgi:hypothetical protein
VGTVILAGGFLIHTLFEALIIFLKHKFDSQQTFLYTNTIKNMANTVAGEMKPFEAAGLDFASTIEAKQVYPLTPHSSVFKNTFN